MRSTGTYVIVMSTALRLDPTSCREGVVVGIKRKKYGKDTTALLEHKILPTTSTERAFETSVLFETLKLAKDDMLQLTYSDLSCIYVYQPLNYVILYKLA